MWKELVSTTGKQREWENLEDAQQELERRVRLTPFTYDIGEWHKVGELLNAYALRYKAKGIQEDLILAEYVYWED